jgi:hypothetical protein
VKANVRESLPQATDDVKTTFWVYERGQDALRGSSSRISMCKWRCRTARENGVVTKDGTVYLAHGAGVKLPALVVESPAR